MILRIASASLLYSKALPQGQTSRIYLIMIVQGGLLLIGSIQRKSQSSKAYPDSKVLGANMGPIWGRQDPGGPHIGPMNFAIWVEFCI